MWFFGIESECSLAESVSVSALAAFQLNIGLCVSAVACLDLCVLLPFLDLVSNPFFVVKLGFHFQVYTGKNGEQWSTA